MNDLETYERAPDSPDRPRLPGLPGRDCLSTWRACRTRWLGLAQPWGRPTAGRRTPGASSADALTRALKSLLPSAASRSPTIAAGHQAGLEVAR